MNKIIGANQQAQMCQNWVGGGCGEFSYFHLVNIEFNGWNMTLLNRVIGSKVKLHVIQRIWYMYN